MKIVNNINNRRYLFISHERKIVKLNLSDKWAIEEETFLHESMKYNIDDFQYSHQLQSVVYFNNIWKDICIPERSSSIVTGVESKQIMLSANEEFILSVSKKRAGGVTVYRFYNQNEQRIEWKAQIQE